MNPLVVVDVGNSRMKWGRCAADRVQSFTSLPLDQPSAWQTQLAAWNLGANTSWLLAGVNPQPLAQLATLLGSSGHTVRTLTAHSALPLEVDVERPEGVGLDRLLNAVALLGTESPAIIIDAGSAVTVDLIDPGPIFRGGAIFPGLRLMAEALHGYTAALPLVHVEQADPPLPGRSTVAAMTVGIHDAVVGGIQHMVRRYQTSPLRSGLVVYLTGGDGPLLAPALIHACTDLGLVLRVWPEMTLEGLRLTGQGRLVGSAHPTEIERP
jgi:type III pantothenate kinase